MSDMKKHTIIERIKYAFDNLMSKGTIALVGVLFLATAVVVVLAGFILALIGQEGTTVGYNMWASIMHIIDAGTITAADTTDLGFVVTMSVVTLCGLFVTSILIGIITTGFEEKLNSLKKGNSHVIEKDHTVILGFNHNVFTLISELIIANENQKDGCIVILSEEEKESVEEAIAGEILDFKNTRIICRTGSMADTNMLEKCAIETSRSIIVNESEDFITVKAILAINNYLKPFKEFGSVPHIVATLNEKSNYDAVQIISDGNAEILVVQDAIARIIAQTCRQPGLSNVLIELFDYDGDELYFENFPEVAGKKFGDVLNYFEKAVVFGYKRNDEVIINPDKDVVLQGDDSLVLLVEDDGAATIKEYEVKDSASLKVESAIADTAGDVLIIGINEMLEQIVVELDSYFGAGSTITIAHPIIDQTHYELREKVKNSNVDFVVCDTNSRESLDELTKGDINHVLILSDDACDTETSDAMTLLKLIHLRDILQKTGKAFNITSEMKDSANQKLAKVAQANDLVVGSNIINLILTQISENRDLATVFQELLTAEGSEIYIRNASYYVKLHTEMDFYTVTEILKEYDAIAIGYKKQNGNMFDVITNPNKSEKIIFTEEDCIISLSAD
ncbi:MAG: hypothetical protein R3Y24_08260 [Eubacteriales bacterium]